MLLTINYPDRVGNKDIQRMQLRTGKLSGSGAEMLDRWARSMPPRAIVAQTVAAECMIRGIDCNGNRIRNMSGGLGVVKGDYELANADPRMRIEDFRGFHVTIGHTSGRGDQAIVHGAQEITPSTWNINDPRLFAPLGTFDSVDLSPDGAYRAPLKAFLFRPHLEGQLEAPLILLTTENEELSRGFYPKLNSPEALRFQKVLGRGAFVIGEELGIYDDHDDIRGTLIMHDCHGALTAYELFQHYMNVFNNDRERALHETRRRCITTIHAPQPGTIYRYPYDVLSQVYSKEDISEFYQLGPDPQYNGVINSLVLAIELSYAFSCVSPGHLEMTIDPANQLIPTHFLERKIWPAKLSSVTPDVVNPYNWADQRQIDLLDRFFPGWQSNPDMFTPEKQAEMLFNQDFRIAFMRMLPERATELQKALCQKGIKQPEETLYASAMRRFAYYKTNIMLQMLKSREEHLKNLANLYGPLCLLFGGIVPDNDAQSAGKLSELFEFMEKINRANGSLSLRFYPNYNEYEAPPILRGTDIWMMFSDPLTPDITQREAFGPSGGKVSLFGGLPIGFSDGWSPHFNRFGQGTTIVGPKTNLHGIDTGKHLRVSMRDPASMQLAREITADDFIFSFGNLLALLRIEKKMIAEGNGHLSPLLPQRIAAMFNALDNFHPRRGLQAYYDIAGKIHEIEMPQIAGNGPLDTE